MTEQRKFSVDPSIIYSLVVAQAGSLGKAVLEAVMNSIDAGASHIDITANSKRLTIVDDGQGFRSRDEITKWFEVFGFPHSETDQKVYGKFGIGRAQLWSFCSTTWRTNVFEMTVDIKRSGLDYGLKEGLAMVPGLTIDAVFYERQKASELAAFERELTELARYAQIPVLFNGKKINKDPAKEKWDSETKEAWIKVTEGGDLAVYNLGVLVKNYPSYTFGIGGIVVTKPGVGLSLNTARNDILVSQCPVWKRLKPKLQAKADDQVSQKKTRLSESELVNLARRFLAAERTFEQIREVKLITDIVGRHHTLEGAARSSNRYGLAITVAESGSRIGERAHTAKLAFVLAPATLVRFGAASVADLKKKLSKAMGKSPHYAADSWQRVKIIEDVGQAAPSLKEGYEVLAEKELKPEEAAALTAIREVARYVGQALCAQGYLSSQTRYREIKVGVSDAAEAWTDGSSKIVIERNQLALVKQGIGGFSGIANLLVHEYLHDDSDVGSHLHDYEFYHRYHEATCGARGILQQAIMKGFAAYLRVYSRGGKTVNRDALFQVDLLQSVELLPEL
jgi:hypothetical protein